MGTRRIIYAFTFAGAALFFILYPFWFSWYLLVLLMLLVPFDLIFSLPGMLSRRIVLSAPKVLEHGQAGTLTITAVTNWPFPAGCIKTWMKVSGDDFKTWRRFVCGAERGSRYEITIDTSRSGVTVFEAKRIWTVSMIGLFCLPTNVDCRTAVLVIPAPVKPPYMVALPRGVLLRPKPGGGFSEDYDLRPYRKGDPIRSVHWKVSAKFDSLIIREPLVLPPHSRLIHAMLWTKARERDLILGRLRWVSDYLLKWDLPYYVRIGDSGKIAEITQREDLLEYLYLVLSGEAEALKTPADVPSRFAWVYQIDGKKGSAVRGQGSGDGGTSQGSGVSGQWSGDEGTSLGSGVRRRGYESAVSG